MSNLSRYVQKHVPDSEFQNRVVYAYLESLLGSTNLLSLFEQMKQNMMKDFIPISFWPTAAKYNDPQLRAFIAYSMLKKDKKLFDMVLWHYNPEGYVRMFISRELFSSYVEFTDEPQIIDGTAYESAFTDTNLYTDMTGGTVYEGMIQVYREDDDPFGLNAPTINELKEKESEMAGFITIIKPARVNVLLLRAPFVQFVPVGGALQHSNCITVVEDTLYTAENLAWFAQQGAATVIGLLPYEIRLEDTSLNVPIDPQYEVVGNQIKATYYVQRDSSVLQDLQEIWQGLQLVTTRGTLKFNINNVQTQLFSTVYFAKINFFFPCRGE